MATDKEKRPVGRPIDHHKRQAILAEGWTMFLERGFEAVSLEAVAAKAGVSKVTLYKYFPDKTALFEAGVSREMEKIEAAQNLNRERSAGAPYEDLAGVLREFGLGIMGFICSDPAVAFYNALAGELSRHPDLAKRFYAFGPGRTKANLTHILEAAGARGELALQNPREAAEHLFGLWQGFSNFQLALGIDRETIREELPTRVEKAVEVFLRAYGYRNGNGS